MALVDRVGYMQLFNKVKQSLALVVDQIENSSHDAGMSELFFTHSGPMKSKRLFILFSFLL